MTEPQVPSEASQPPRGPDIGLPFFAYGIFMPGEIAFFQIRDHVSAVVPATVPGILRIRDGIPVLDRTVTGTADGVRIDFKRDASKAAYTAIQNMEPRTQYKWQVVAGMNVLAAIKPRNGTRPLSSEQWSSWADPSLIDALTVVDEALADQFVWEDFRPFYRLQAAYMLLWSSIERYVSLRYGLGRNDRVMQRVARLIDEPGFEASIRAIERSALQHLRPVYRSDDPEGKVSFDPEAESQRAVSYFYQVRSNVTHRGKEEPLDWELLHTSTAELLRVFRALLAEAERESGWAEGVNPTSTAGA